MLFRNIILSALVMGAGTACSKPGTVVPGGPGTGGFTSSISLFAGSETERGETDNTNPTSALFDHPAVLALDGNTMWVADGYNESSLRRINLSTGAVTTAIRWNNFDGVSGSRRSINDLEVNPVTHKLLMVTKQGELWEYNPANGQRQLIIDGEDPDGAIKDEYDGVQIGSLAKASAAEAYGLAISRDGALVFLSDNTRGIIKQVNLSNVGNEVTIYAGKPYTLAHDVSQYAFANGARLQSTFSNVQDLSITKDGKLLVVDNGWSCLRTVDETTVSSLTNHNPGVSTTGLNKDGSIADAMLNRPAHAAVSDAGIFFIDYAGVRILRPGNDVTTLHPDFSVVHRSGAIAASVCVTPDGKTVFEAQGNAIYKYSVQAL